MLRAVARAKIAEAIAPAIGMADRSSELFLMGMFSLIDALMDTSMSDILDKLPLDQEIKRALLGEDCPFRTVYGMIEAYEKAEWDRFAELARTLGVDENVVPDLFTDSLKWANEAFTIM
jgi:EAL and modified HD-GYP domain-containing signal transduction protein